MKRHAAVTVLACLAGSGLAWAHQPVMDMAPRWNRGWGVQVRNEWRNSHTVKAKDHEADNPMGRKRRVNQTWVEGVYAWTPEVRVTAKIPWVEQRRTIVRGATAVEQSGRGWGDLILGLPLKKLITGPGTLADFTFTPSVRVPTGDTTDEFPTGDGSTDFGVSVTYKRDVHWFYQYYDLFYWANGHGSHDPDVNRDGDEVGFDMNVGVLPYHNMETNTGVWLMWDYEARYQDRGRDADGQSGGIRISTGPMAMWYKDNLLVHVQYNVPIYEWLNGTQVTYGHEAIAAVGISF